MALLVLNETIPSLASVALASTSLPQKFHAFPSVRSGA